MKSLPFLIYEGKGEYRHEGSKGFSFQQECRLKQDTYYVLMGKYRIQADFNLGTKVTIQMDSTIESVFFWKKVYVYGLFYK